VGRDSTFLPSIFAFGLTARDPLELTTCTQ
jgi:hypothetical protein